ncbi:hypothetical protein D3C76_467410 [compost metagenome]
MLQALFQLTPVECRDSGVRRVPAIVQRQRCACAGQYAECQPQAEKEVTVEHLGLGKRHVGLATRGGAMSADEFTHVLGGFVGWQGFIAHRTHAYEGVESGSQCLVDVPLMFIRVTGLRPGCQIVGHATLQRHRLQRLAGDLGGCMLSDDPAVGGIRHIQQYRPRHTLDDADSRQAHAVTGPVSSSARCQHQRVVGDGSGDSAVDLLMAEPFQ